MAKILVVEDEKLISNLVRDCLTRDNHLVETVDNGKDGLFYIKAYIYDLVILDWMLPEMTGMEILQSYRESGGKCLVLMLTAQASIDDKEKGLNFGADDYLTKPFNPRELVARVRALLRRHSPGTQLLKIADIELDPQGGSVTSGGEPVALSRREFSLLEFFMRHPNQVFNAETLLDRVWKSDTQVSQDTVRSHIKSLRAKLAVNKNESVIKTIHGIGYKIEG